MPTINNINYSDDLKTVLGAKFIDSKTVKIIDSVERINKNAFRLCKMENVILPNNLKYIDKSAFEYCENLKNIILPESLLQISGSAFRNCISLTNVKLSPNIKEIDFLAFDNTPFLESLKNEKELQIYEKYLVNGKNVNKEEIIIPKDIEIMSNNCFFHSEIIKSVSLENTKITEIPKSCFHLCNHLNEIFFSNNIEKINSQAFAGCSFKKIIIPASVKEIDTYAFYGNSSLSEVIILSNDIDLDEDIFAYCNSIDTIYMSENAIEKNPLFARKYDYKIKPLTLDMLLDNGCSLKNLQKILISDEKNIEI